MLLSTQKVISKNKIIFLSCDDAKLFELQQHSTIFDCNNRDKSKVIFELQQKILYSNHKKQFRRLLKSYED